MRRSLSPEEKRKYEQELTSLQAPLRQPRVLAGLGAACLAVVIVRFSPIPAGWRPNTGPAEGVYWAALAIVGGGLLAEALLMWAFDHRRLRREIVRQALRAAQVEEDEGMLDIQSSSRGCTTFHVRGRRHTWHDIAGPLPQNKAIVRVTYRPELRDAVDVRSLVPGPGWSSQDLRIYLEEQGLEFSPADSRDALWERTRRFLDNAES